MCNSYFIFLECKSDARVPLFPNLNCSWRNSIYLCWLVTLMCWFILFLLCLCLALVIWFFFSWYDILIDIVPNLSYFGSTINFPRAIAISTKWKWYLPNINKHLIVLMKLPNPSVKLRYRIFPCLTNISSWLKGTFWLRSIQRSSTTGSTNIKIHREVDVFDYIPITYYNTR